MDDHPTGERITRRASLLRLAGLVGGAVGLRAFGSAAARAETAGTTGAGSGTVACVLTPETTEGPYYIPVGIRRRDITAGRPGTPLTLRLSVVDASTCRPIRGATVDIWHCDAGGLYSGYTRGSGGGGSRQRPTDATRFLRGARTTGPAGVAVVDTIYPGWYPGRTVHVHVKVHVRGNVVHTGQLYFPETVTAAVYARTPYSARRNRDTTNAGDRIFGSGGARSMLRLRRAGKGYVGSITMGVQD